MNSFYVSNDYGEVIGGRRFSTLENAVNAAKAIIRTSSAISNSQHGIGPRPELSIVEERDVYLTIAATVRGD